jgi:hypothetical protein
MTDIREDRASLFRNLEHADTQGRFWELVAADVDWTVEGTHPLAGRYRGKKEFIQATFERGGRTGELRFTRSGVGRSSLPGFPAPAGTGILRQCEPARHRSAVRGSHTMRTGMAGETGTASARPRLGQAQSSLAGAASRGGGALGEPLSLRDDGVLRVAEPRPSRRGRCPSGSRQTR